MKSSDNKHGRTKMCKCSDCGRLFNPKIRPSFVAPDWRNMQKGDDSPEFDEKEYEVMMEKLHNLMKKKE